MMTLTNPVFAENLKRQLQGLPLLPKFFDFHPPAYFTGYQMPPDAILVGDCHLTRGDLTVIGGVAGCGKSRLLMSLAIAGMDGRGGDWMGLPVHDHFRTAILQAENGEVRLQRELQDIEDQGYDLEDWLSVTPPPPYGLAFTSPEFRAQLRDWLAQVRPGVLAIDPWNRCTPDDKAKDYRSILDAVFEVLPDGDDKPALVIVHHLRKQSTGETRRRGRDLLNELSGSYVIGSACRVAFILEPATPDGDDDRVVFTCAKNNNGEMGSPSAWYRKNGLFTPCADFDWDGWQNNAVPKRRSVELEDLAAVFSAGGGMMTRRQVAETLESLTGLKRSTVYEAIKPGGRFAKHLTLSGGVLQFRA